MKKVLKNSALVTVLVLACTAATLFVSPSVDSKVYGAENGANTVDEVKVALQEVAYSYYMRGKSIQYNTMKRNGFFSPESATKQNTQYTVCSGYTQNIYHELLGISIPFSTTKLINYARDNAGNPEVAAFGEREDNGDFKLTFFDNGNKSKEVTNPTTADILPCLQPGDVLTCTGHAIFLYNLIYDDDGKITDAETIESTYGDGKIINVESKVATNVPDGVERFGNNNHYLYHGDGSLYYGKLSDSDTWTRLSDSGKANCSILRFIQSDTNGNAVLNYRGAAYGDRDYINEAIELNSTAKARIRFEKLYIEKTVDVFNDSIVEAGDKLTYTLTVKNKSRKDYTEDLKIIENIPENTTYNSCEADNSEAKITVDEKGGKIECNVGKLGLDHKVTLTYTVTVNKSSEGKTVISAGSVGGISTAEIYNPISKNLTKEQKAAIVKSCKKLTGKYSGKQLINAVYKDALGVNLGIDAIKVTDIINNTDKTSTASATISLKENSKFGKAVLNRYYSALAQKENEFNNGKFYTFDLKNWREYGDKDRRADTVYGENFKTGDILIYNNRNDKDYSSEKQSTVSLTFEDGEYAFIYIEGTGFVGLNLGDDNKKGTKDDRNVFSADYYRKVKKTLCGGFEDFEDEEREFLNYQTLFGKDNYVILRPSLSKELMESSSLNLTVILIVTAGLLILTAVAIIIIKQKKKK